MGYDEMEQFGPYLRRFFNDHDGCTYFWHLCPACDETHRFVLNDSGQYWAFNYNREHPTFSPSMRISSNIPRSPEERIKRVEYTTCHYFIRNGMIEYCADSPHHLAGKTIPLPEWPKEI